MDQRPDDEPWDWQISAIIVRFVIGVFIGAFSGFGYAIKWLPPDRHEYYLSILGGAALFGVASALFGDRFWKGFLSLFSRD